jgi:cytochrome c5
MSFARRAGWLAVAGFVSIGCAHARTQQTEGQPQQSASPAAAVTPPVATLASPPAASADAVAVAAPAPAAADFAHDVRPILEKHCQPCHFEGGKMYERLPFDRAETIQRLGTKLFTRIKAEDEQAVIRRFLAQGS